MVAFTLIIVWTIFAAVCIYVCIYIYYIVVIRCSKVICRSWDFSWIPLLRTPCLSRRTTEPESFEPIPLSCAWCDKKPAVILIVSVVFPPFLRGCQLKRMKKSIWCNRMLSVFECFFHEKLTSKPMLINASGTKTQDEILWMGVTNVFTTNVKTNASFIS